MSNFWILSLGTFVLTTATALGFRSLTIFFLGAPVSLGLAAWSLWMSGWPL